MSGYVVCPCFMARKIKPGGTNDEGSLGSLGAWLILLLWSCSSGCPSLCTAGGHPPGPRAFQGGTPGRTSIRAWGTCHLLELALGISLSPAHRALSLVERPPSAEDPRHGH